VEVRTGAPASAGPQARVCFEARIDEAFGAVGT
jgi:hypothetical protein